MCALILWRSDLKLLMDKFHQFLTELTGHHTSVFSFQDNNLSKSQQIFTKLDICIDIVEILFWITIGYISSILEKLSPHDTIIAGYYHFTFLFSIERTLI